MYTGRLCNPDIYLFTVSQIKLQYIYTVVKKLYFPINVVKLLQQSKY